MGCSLVSNKRPTVGDTVRVVKDIYEKTFPVGSEFVIEEDDHTNVPYAAKRDGATWWFKASEVEAVNAEPNEDLNFEPLSFFGALRAMGVNITVTQYEAALVIAQEVFTELSEHIED